MKKIALLNGKLIDSKRDTIEKTNILLINDKVVGMGYVPDDENAEQIDLINQHIIPNITSFSLYPNAHHKDANKTGITRWMPITYLKNNAIPTIEACQNSFALGTIQGNIPSEPLSKLLAFSKETTLPLVTNAQGSELLYLFQHLKDHGGSLHCVLSEDPTSLPLIEQAKKNGLPVSCSLPANQLYLYNTRKQLPTIIQAIKNNTINAITTGTMDEALFLPLTFTYLKDHLPLTQIAHLISTTYADLFRYKNKGVALYSTPSLTAVDIKNTQLIPPFQESLTGFPTYTF